MLVVYEDLCRKICGVLVLCSILAPFLIRKCAWKERKKFAIVASLFYLVGDGRKRAIKTIFVQQLLIVNFLCVIKVGRTSTFPSTTAS